MVALHACEQQVTDASLSAFTSHPAFGEWRSRVESVGGCAQPVKLNSRTRTTSARTGTLLSVEDRAVWVRCGTRRAAACPACSARYEADAYHLVRAGLCGDEDKGVPATVADRPTAFVTLTAPSFGPVHSRPAGRPCACRAWHREADPRLGQALDPARYDFEAAVLWNNRAGALWADFTRRLRRALAGAGGLTVREAASVMKVSYAKVAEYQRRGQVHFHAAIRIDGPAGCASPPPRWATTAVLTEAIGQAASATEVDAERADRSPLVLRWGSQLDIQTVAAGPAETAGGSTGAATCGGPGTVQASPGTVQTGPVPAGSTSTAPRPMQVDAAVDPDRRTDAGRVASYIAKYATKSTGVTDGVDRRVTTFDDIEATGANRHAKAMMRTALQLAEVPHLAHLRLDQWAHMLGYRGHFLTKSRAFSTTFAALRDARAAWALAQNMLDTGGPSDVLVDTTWQVVGYGYRTPEEHTIAAAIAESFAHSSTRREAVSQ